MNILKYFNPLIYKIINFISPIRLYIPFIIDLVIINNESQIKMCEQLPEIIRIPKETLFTNFLLSNIIKIVHLKF